MSFSFTVTGHSSEPHNAEVVATAEAAVASLRAVPGMANLTLNGYSNDGTGSVTLALDPTSTASAGEPPEIAGPVADDNPAEAPSPTQEADVTASE